MENRFLYGLQYLDNNNPNSFNPQKGYDYFLQLLDEGLDYSKVVLGFLLSEGIGVEKNLELADRYFEEAKKFANAEVVEFINEYISVRAHNEFYSQLYELCKHFE